MFLKVFCFVQIDIALSLGTPFHIFHHHLIEMLDHVLPRPEKRIFNCLSSTTAVIDFLWDPYLAQNLTESTDFG